MGVCMHDKCWIKECNFGYGTLYMYRCAVAKALGIEEAFEKSLYWGRLSMLSYVTQEKEEYRTISNNYVEEVESKVIPAVADFLYACDCNAEFNRKQCDKIYKMLKSIKLPRDYNPVIKCYSTEFDIHKTFLEIFKEGRRYKNKGVEWY